MNRSEILSVLPGCLVIANAGRTDGEHVGNVLANAVSLARQVLELVPQDEVAPAVTPGPASAEG